MDGDLRGTRVILVSYGYFGGFGEFVVAFVDEHHRHRVFTSLFVVIRNAGTYSVFPLAIAGVPAYRSDVTLLIFQEQGNIQPVYGVSNLSQWLIAYREVFLGEIEGFAGC